MKKLITLRVNGDSYEVAVEPWAILADVLRENLGLTGTKKACDLGNCGSCTVLMNGKPVLSCLVLALDAQGKDIMTIEGMTKEIMKTIPSEVMADLKENSFALDIRFEKDESEKSEIQFGRSAIGRLDENFMAFLDTLDLKGFDKERLNQKAIEYLTREE